jgi:hypothetical protein
MFPAGARSSQRTQYPSLRVSHVRWREHRYDAFEGPIVHLMDRIDTCKLASVMGDHHCCDERAS